MADFLTERERMSPRSFCKAKIQYSQFEIFRKNKQKKFSSEKNTILEKFTLADIFLREKVKYLYAIDNFGMNMKAFMTFPTDSWMSAYGEL